MSNLNVPRADNPQLKYTPTEYKAVAEAFERDEPTLDPMTRDFMLYMLNHGYTFDGYTPTGEIKLKMPNDAPELVKTSEHKPIAG